MLKFVTEAILTVFLATAPAAASDDPDLIFMKTTVWKLLSPDHKLATYAIDDPLVEGVACHFTVPEKGGWTGWRLRPWSIWARSGPFGFGAAAGLLAARPAAPRG